jgi:hypothetical protein
LQYSRARWYDATLGRFISEDPIGFAGGDVNLFSYVHSNSINKTDPLGLLDPIIRQDPNQYTQNLNKLSCDIKNQNPWIGFEGGGNFHLATVGYGLSGGFEFNPLTGQFCFFVKSSPRLGLGLFAGAGLKVNLDLQDRLQVNGANRIQPELAADFGFIEGGKGRVKYSGGKFMPNPLKHGGFGHDVSTSGVGIGGGPGIGLGGSIGVDFVKKYTYCFNAPPECACDR